MLEDFGSVDNSHGLTPEQLLEKVSGSDALIIRSATQVQPQELCCPVLPAQVVFLNRHVSLMHDVAEG